MNEQEKAKKLQEALADKAFAEKVLGLETAEEVQSALRDKGVELSVQEICDIRKGLAQQLESGEEIDPEQLKNVSGGFLLLGMGIAAILGMVGIAVHNGTRKRW